MPNERRLFKNTIYQFDALAERLNDLWLFYADRLCANGDAVNGGQAAGLV